MVDTRHSRDVRRQGAAVSASALVGFRRMINEGRLNDLPAEHLLEIQNKPFLPTV